MNVKLIHDQINEAMEKIAAEHGLTYVRNTLRYTTDNFRLSVEMVKPNVIQLTNSQVQNGLAPLGSTIKVGKYGPGIVLKASYGKYKVELPQGKTGTIAFAACSAIQ